MSDPTTMMRAAGEMPAWQRERRERIVRAALELLQHGEYEKIQVRDVAERAGFALGTIYRYFNSKEHLYAAVLLEWASFLTTNLHREPLRGEPPDRLKQLIRRVVRAFERRPQFLRLEIVLENSTDRDALGVFHDAAERNHTSFLAALPNLPSDVATQIIFVVTSVLYRLLHQFALGRGSIEYVLRTAEGTVDLIFSTPPAAVVAPEEAAAGLMATIESPASSVLVETSGAARIITLNRPRKLNAVDLEMQQRLLEHLQAVQGDSRVRAVVITGGGRAFSSGGDRTLLAELAAGALADRDELGRVQLETIRCALSLPVPVIAAVNGPAVGVAAGIVAVCDVVIMGEDAFLCDPHVTFGLGATFACQLIWPHLTSRLVAKDS